jgi:hypothetical protein
MTERPRRLLLVAGSLDAGDATTRLLAAATTMPGPFAEIRWADVAPLPLYDTAAPRNDAVAALLADAAWADALLVGVPEHHGGPAARTKNLLDWLATAPVERPAGIAVAGSAARDPRALRGAFLRAGLGLVDPVVAAPDETAFDDGLLVDPVIRRSIALQLEALAAAGRED